LVAADLGAEVVDKFLIDEVAKRLGLSPSEVEAAERPRPWLNALMRSLGSLEPALGAGWAPPFIDPLYDPRAEVIALTEQVIREVAKSGNVVIIGRGAGFVLRETPGVLRVFLSAPQADCLATLKARYGWDDKTARARKHETDANRAAYSHQLYGHDWRDPDAYDLMLNTGRLGYEGAAAAILTDAHGPIRA
jgi:hypothetical protein